jgi:uncharacterized protein (DUF488 family)
MSRSAGNDSACHDGPVLHAVRAIYTVGHGNRAQTDFIDLLGAAGVEMLIDVRTHPVSRRYPHFRWEPLQAALERTGVACRWMGKQLGGRRAVRPDSPHMALADGLRGFADHMQTDTFRMAVDELLILAGRSQTAIMCAEKRPEHCHRSLIADYLTCQNITVIHLINLDERHEHQLSMAARKVAGGLMYDRNATADLNL